MVIMASIMSAQHRSVVLPSRTEAIGAIRDFVERSGTVTNSVELARVLGGVSASFSTIAHEHGESHPVAGRNLGLKVTIGEGVAAHTLGIIQQDRSHNAGGANVWRTAIQGGREKYHQKVVLPTDESLQQFLNDDKRAKSLPWKDIYATATATAENSVHTYEMHTPFRPTTLGEEHSSFGEGEARAYARILRDLSTTVLEVVE